MLLIIRMFFFDLALQREKKTFFKANNTSCLGYYGICGLKMDMSKAYDRIQPFLKVVLDIIEFSQQWVKFIMKCVSSMSFFVLLNGGSCQVFTRKRGLPQGNSLSPCLLVVCEVFQVTFLKQMRIILFMKFILQEVQMLAVK